MRHSGEAATGVPPPAPPPPLAGYATHVPGLTRPPDRSQAPAVVSPGTVEQVQKRFSLFLEDIRGFSFKWIVPYETAFARQTLQNPSVMAMLFFGFFPLAIVGLGLITSVQTLLFYFIMYFTLAWAGYYYMFVSRRTVDWRYGLAALAFTAIVGIPLVLAIQTIPPFSALYRMTNAPDLFSRIIGFVLGVGLNEELFKAVPVLILGFQFKLIKKPLDGIFFGALSGLGFGIPEGMQYIGNAEGAGIIIQALIRITSLPFLHSMWSAIVGYFIALALINRHRAPALLVIGLSIAIVHHGLYDVFSSGPLGVILAASLYLLFVAYIERSQDMVRELEAAEADAILRERGTVDPVSGAMLAPPTSRMPVPPGFDMER